MTPITSPGTITQPGDYYLANDIVITDPSQITALAALYITAAGVRLNMNGKTVRGVGLSPNVASYGILGNATNNLVIFDGQVGGVTGFWCGIQSNTPWTRLQELVLSGNYNIGATLCGHTSKACYNLIDGIGGDTTDPYNAGLNVGGDGYEVRGNVIRNIYKSGSGTGEGVPIILSASSSGGLCERNFLENDTETDGTIGIFAGSGGAHTVTGNVITGMHKAIQGGGTSGSPMTATGNVIRLRETLSGSVGISADYGMVEDNTIINYGEPIIGSAPAVNNTIYPS